jgi:hypothetical protein
MGIIAKDDKAYNCRFEMAGHYPEGKVSLSPLSPDTKVEGAESQNIKDYQSWLLKEDDIPGEFLIYFP